jgi:hypothetical protein
VLTKEYFVTDFLSLENPILDEVKVSAINWNAGKNVCKAKPSKKAKKGKKKVSGLILDVSGAL